MILILSLETAAQGGSEIYLFDLQIKNGVISLSNPVNISNHPGYDNQPSFHRNDKLIFYSSFNDSGRSEIMQFNYLTNKVSAITKTPEREYSPTQTPDGLFLSCIIQRDNGQQDLGKYPIHGKKEATVLINELKVGYHVWINESSLLLFVLEDSAGNALHHYNLHTRHDTVLVKNPGRSLHRIPGTNEFSFIHKLSKDEWLIKKFNPASNQITTIAQCIPGREDIVWLNNYLILSSDGLQFFYLDTRSKNDWRPIELTVALGFKGISRLSVNSDHTKLAVVAAE
ncbi:MAG: PD40 domain-containing protein [Chitinophagaceae bacterium]|nr:PD40 domain-containing protein [Chitinophagaceae bacterium]